MCYKNGLIFLISLQEPPVTPPNSGSGSTYGPPGGTIVPTSSSYPSHVYQQQNQQQQQQPHQATAFFPKKEFQPGHLSEFYQPPQNSSFPQYSPVATPIGGHGDHWINEHPGGPHGPEANQQHTSVTSSSLSHALQGVMHNMTDRSVIGAIRSVRRSQYGDSQQTPSNPTPG
jgi:hypothetical protein